MRYVLVIAFFIVVAYGLFLFWQAEHKIEINSFSGDPHAALPDIVEAPPPSEASSTILSGQLIAARDIENQKPLSESLPTGQAPQVIKAAYATSWSAGSASKVNYLIDLIKNTELNAVVIDIKDYSGYVAYDINNEAVIKYGAREVRIPRINALIKRLHDEGIYVVARITLFQDPVLAKARPDLAIKSRAAGQTWKDRKGLSWIDPAAKDAWDYNIAIAKDAASRGFDELNFDYIRFASDGNLSDMAYPFYTGTMEKHKIIAEFFRHLRSELQGVKISADLFGLSTVNHDDLGIGQVIEDAYQYFDYVSPMVYPSHYANGFLGFQIPAAHPYDVVRYSMDSALRRLKNYESGVMNYGSSTTSTISNSEFIVHNSKLRPWLQDFNLGATYDTEKVRAQIKAVEDAGLHDGWMLWNPSNVYTREALK